MELVELIFDVGLIFAEEIIGKTDIKNWSHRFHGFYVVKGIDTLCKVTPVHEILDRIEPY